jgi:hypothetical protein
MAADDPNLLRSIELAKAGFENAQTRIGVIDTKVSIAVGLLIVLLPAPLVIAGWFAGLDPEIATEYVATLKRNAFFSFVCWSALFLGMCAALAAMICGLLCLSPRGPKGYGKTGSFQNEWRPNILFPIYQPDRYSGAAQHFKRLESGLDMHFVIAEYQHQLEQLGRILGAKFADMGRCFFWLKVVIYCYGIALICAAAMTLSLFSTKVTSSLDSGIATQQKWDSGI